MSQMVSHFQELITQVRSKLPENSALAQAIDRQQPLEQIAKGAINDGYIEKPEEFVQFVEVYARHITQ